MPEHNDHGWLPIETAPTDGKWLLLAFETGPRIEDWSLGRARRLEIGWCDGRDCPVAYRPTHWRLWHPLPNPDDSPAPEEEHPRG